MVKRDSIDHSGVKKVILQAYLGTFSIRYEVRYYKILYQPMKEIKREIKHSEDIHCT